jgi:hypothetical protein
MPSINLEQALFLRPDRQAPRLIARSSGFDTSWVSEAEALMHDFGERPMESFRCPPATVFAKLLTDRHVAVVRVRDDHDGAMSARIRQGEPGFYSTGLRFHFLVVDKRTYESWIRDPFMLAAKVQPAWDATELSQVLLPNESFSPRTVAQVQGVLKRVKAAALKEGDDPESPDFERTIENSESPVLLGAAQILVDGGRVIFERPEGDVALVTGLWLLLPEATRVRLWPTSFAFSDGIDFDVLVVPHVEEKMVEGYTTEEQAGDYPTGSYELALQRAVEAGDQKELDVVYSRRDSRQTIKLILMLLLGLSLLVLASRMSDWFLPSPSANALSVEKQKLAAAVGIVGVGDPFTSASMLTFGESLWNPEVKARAKK